MLLRDPIEIEITEAVKKQKITVKNAKNNWVIPNTGGSGTTILRNWYYANVWCAIFL